MASLPFSRPVFLADNNYLVDNNSELISELPDATREEKLAIVDLINSAPDPATSSPFQLLDSTSHTLPLPVRKELEQLRGYLALFLEAHSTGFLPPHLATEVEALLSKL